MLTFALAAYIAYALWLDQPKPGRTGFFISALANPVARFLSRKK